MTHKQYRYQGSRRRNTTGQESNEVSGAFESGARVCGNEAEVRVCESALSRIEEERQPAVRHLRPGQPVLGAQEAVVLSGVVSFQDARQPERGSRTGSKSQWE